MAFGSLMALGSFSPALTAAAAMAGALIAAMATTVPGALMPCRRLRFVGAGRLAHPGDGLSDQLLDCGHRLRIDRAHDGDGGAALAGAPGAADPVHIVVGVVRHVEIEYVADVRDIEP